MGLRDLLKDFFGKEKQKPIEEEKKSRVFPSDVERYNPKTRKYYREAYNKRKGFFKIEVTDHYLKHLENEKELLKKWYEDAEPILVEILDKNKDKVDGLKYYGDREGIHNKLILRPDKKFNIEWTDTSYGEKWPGYLEDNQGKGYTSKQIVHNLIGGPNTSHQIVPLESFQIKRERDRLIEEVKKKTGIDLKKEIKKRREKSKGLEGKFLFILTGTGIIVGLFFLSTNITGNTIADLSNRTSSYLGAGLLLLSLIEGFLLLKSREK